MRRRLGLALYITIGVWCLAMDLGAGDLFYSAAEMERFNKFADDWNTYVAKLNAGERDVKLWKKVQKDWEMLTR